MCGQALPAGWAAYVDTEGRTYYANTTTGESSWTLPEAAMLPDGWTEHQDAEGRVFYANVSTGESSWTRPSIMSTDSLGYTAHQDAEGRTFYVNTSTGESSWTCPVPTADTPVPTADTPACMTDAPVVQKEFGSKKINAAQADAALVDQGSYAQRLEDRLMCGGFFSELDHFVKQHAQKFGNLSADGSGYTHETYQLFREYSCIPSKRCQSFLQTEGVSAEEVVGSMVAEEEQGKKFKSSEYLMAAIDFEMFVSLMLDFQDGVKDVSKWWEVCQEERDSWYACVPAE